MENRVSGTFFGVRFTLVHFLSLDDLIHNKQAFGRSTDLDQLKQIPKGTEGE
jgi:hypothetical protein